MQEAIFTRTRSRYSAAPHDLKPRAAAASQLNCTIKPENNEEEHDVGEMLGLPPLTEQESSKDTMSSSDNEPDHLMPVSSSSSTPPDINTAGNNSTIHTLSTCCALHPIRTVTDKADHEFDIADYPNVPFEGITYTVQESVPMRNSFPIRIGEDIMIVTATPGSSKQAGPKYCCCMYVVDGIEEKTRRILVYAEKMKRVVSMNGEKIWVKSGQMIAIKLSTDKIVRAP